MMATLVKTALKRGDKEFLKRNNLVMSVEDRVDVVEDRYNPEYIRLQSSGHWMSNLYHIDDMSDYIRQDSSGYKSIDAVSVEADNWTLFLVGDEVITLTKIY